MTNTKEKILDVALELFSSKGFDAVSVETIASKVGIKAPSLYKHYSSKKAIFEAILKKMEAHDALEAQDSKVPVDSIDNAPQSYEGVNIDDLIFFSKKMFVYWTENEFARNFRKLLTIEQFKDEKMQTLYCKYLSTGPLEYLEDIFAKVPFIKSPSDFALEFYGPMFLLYSAFDDKERPFNLDSLDKHFEAVKAHYLKEQAAFIQN